MVKVWNSQKAFFLRTIAVCRFEEIDGVKYVYCIKYAYYRPPEGGRLYDMKVESSYAFLRTYYV